MGCPSCAAELAEGAAFCHVCGTRQRAPGCAHCAAELPTGAAFCPVCGTPTGAVVPPATVSPAATVAAGGGPPPVGASERRLTSVLFADLVSYTTLSEKRDTEDVRDLLTKYFEVCTTVIRRYGGTVEKFIGDAVMAVWGVPTAHEDDAERAVRAGLELVTEITALGESLAIPELALRAGVVTGEVTTTVGATDQGMVAGDPVNTASRIQSAAAPNEVWVDANTRALTASAITYHDAGEHVLKGKIEPVRLYVAGSVVAGVGGQQRVDGLEAPLAGRDRELRLIKELFHATAESGKPRLVVLDGEAGIGKTRLSWEFEKYIDGLPATTRWHRSRCMSYGDRVAFWALAEAVRGRIGVVGDDEEVDAGQLLDTTLAAFVTDPEELAWLRPRVASLIGEHVGDFPREDLFSAWIKFFERIGGPDPVVLLIDDAHFADSGLLDFVEQMLSSARAAIFLFLLARPELLEARPDLGGRRSTVIHLEPLPDTAMQQLVDGLVEGLPHQTRDALVERSEGIPLFAVETVRALIDRDLVQAVEGSYRVAGQGLVDLASVAAPASLHALIAARLDALSNDERRVVTDASVLGNLFSREGIGILCADLDDLDEVLASLQRKEILGRETDRFSAERGQIRFVQSVVRQVSYSTLSRRDRKARHLSVAQHLERTLEKSDDLAMVVAHHLLDAVEASNPEDEDLPGLRARAAELLEIAADRAAALGSYDDALRAYSSALERIESGPTRAALLEKAAEVCEPLGQLARGVELATEAREAFDALGDAVGAGRAASGVGRCHMVGGQPELAVTEVKDRFYELASVPGAEAARARLGSVLCRSLISLGAPDHEMPLTEVLRLAEQAADPRELARAVGVFGAHQLARGSSRLGIAALRLQLDVARETGLWSGVVGSQQNLGILMMPNTLPAALEMLHESVATGREHGMLVVEGAANMASALWVAGEWETLESTLRTAVEDGIADRHGFHLIAGAVDEWREGAGLDRVVPVVQLVEASDLNGRAWTGTLSAARALRDGDPVTAVREARASVELSYQDATLGDDFMYIWPAAVRIVLEAGDLPAAAELVERVASEPGTLSVALRAYLAVFRGMLGARSGAEPTEVQQNLETGIAELGAYGAVPDKARAQEELGRWLLAQGRGAEGRQQLELARETYSRLGATAWVARLDEALVPSVS